MEKIFYQNLEQLTLNNNYYRHVLYTDKYSQLVIQNILPFQEVGIEIHPKITQFLRCESGNGIVIIEQNEYQFYDGIAITIPFNHYHNIINNSNSPLKFYTIYSTNLKK